MVLDGAGWHKSKTLSIPYNIELLPLPPYAPELNPVEHLWDYIKEQKGFNNYCFPSMDKLEDHLYEVLNQLHHEKHYLHSLCAFSWIIKPP
jgi:transposase